MTATVDLILLREFERPGGVPLYEPEWAILHYSDTSGLWDRGKEEFIVKGAGVIIDALFGDGPKRYGLTSMKPVLLVKYDYGKKRVVGAPDREQIEDYHLVANYECMLKVKEICKQDRHCDFRALSLKGFRAVLQKILPEDMRGRDHNTVPMNGFLNALQQEEKWLVAPLIGLGLSYECEGLSDERNYRVAVISPHRLK